MSTITLASPAARKEARKARNMAAAADRLASLQNLQKQANYYRREFGLHGSDTVVIERGKVAQATRFVNEALAGKTCTNPTYLMRWLKNRHLTQGMERGATLVARFLGEHPELRKAA